MVRLWFPLSQKHQRYQHLDINWRRNLQPLLRESTMVTNKSSNLHDMTYTSFTSCSLKAPCGLCDTQHGHSPSNSWQIQAASLLWLYFPIRGLYCHYLRENVWRTHLTLNSLITNGKCLLYFQPISQDQSNGTDITVI